jgi:hypothetical protein
MTRTERREAMLAHVAAWQQSGQSRKAYCAEHGLAINTLHHWCARSRRAGPRTGFSPVEVTAPPGLELHYPNGVRLLLPAGTVLEQVAACIRLC